MGLRPYAGEAGGRQPLTGDFCLSGKKIALEENSWPNGHMTTAEGTPFLAEPVHARPHDAAPGALVRASRRPTPCRTSRPGCAQLRRRRGLTLEAAAARAGLSPAHLSRLETARRQPSLPMLLGLARTYWHHRLELLGETAPERDPIVRAGRSEPVEADGWTCRQAGAAGRAMRALRVRVPTPGSPTGCGCTPARSGCTSSPAASPGAGGDGARARPR